MPDRPKLEAKPERHGNHSCQETPYPSIRAAGFLGKFRDCYVGASGDLHGLFALLGEAKLRPLRAVGASSQAGREFSDVMNT
eukprot:s6940_g2.t1